jgi:hypothetical protein
MREMINALLSMSDSQVDQLLRPHMQSWSDNPTALQLLKVLDMAIHGSLASGFVIGALQVMYDMACKAENLTHEEIAKSAHWRAV